MDKRDTFVFVVNIRTPFIDENGNKNVHLGTGFFVSKGKKYYLVTASHVARDTTRKSYIVLSDNQNNPTPYPLISMNINLKWLHHSIADLSVLEIDASTNNWISTRAFPFDYCDIDNKKLDRDVLLTVVGFPANLGINGKFSPITFRSYPASDIVSVNRFDTHTPQDFFFLENPSIGGYSGGPVFDLATIKNGIMTMNTGKPSILGIVHGVLGSMATITPIFYLSDII